MTTLHVRCPDLPLRWDLLNDRWQSVGTWVGDQRVLVGPGRWVLRLRDTLPDLADTAVLVTDQTPDIVPVNLYDLDPTWVSPGLRPETQDTVDAIAHLRQRRPRGAHLLLVAAAGRQPPLIDGPRARRLGGHTATSTWVAPGTHSLQQPSGRAQPVYVPPGFDALVFTHHPADLTRSIVHLVRHEDAYADAAHRDLAALTETAHRMLAEADGRGALSLAGHLRDIHASPLTALMAIRLAYLTLRGTWGRVKADRQPAVNGAVEALTRYVERVAPDHPDLRAHHAIRATFERRRGPAAPSRLTEPPTLADAWRTVLATGRDAAGDDPRLDPYLGDDRRLGSIAAATLPESLWTAWNEPAAQRLQPARSDWKATAGTLHRAGAEALRDAARGVADAPTLALTLRDAAFLRDVRETTGASGAVYRAADLSPAVLDIARHHLERP
jgi:hypothetical protein